MTLSEEHVRTVYMCTLTLQYTAGLITIQLRFGHHGTMLPVEDERLLLTEEDNDTDEFIDEDRLLVDPDDGNTALFTAC